MNTDNNLLEQFLLLGLPEQEAILLKLQQEFELQMPVIEMAKEDALKIGGRKSCPKCNSNNVYKRGSQNKVQMYSCKDCKKWYSASTGTPLWSIKLKEKWAAYLRCMTEGYSLRRSAKEVGICLQTSFDWRHKILASLNSLVPEKISGIIECDELELAINEKGDRDLIREPRKRSTDFSRNKTEEVSVVQVVTAVERQGEKILKVVEAKRLSHDDISKALEGKLEDSSIFITDKHPSYKAFGKINPKITHKTVRASDHVNKKDRSVHLQTVNQTHTQLRKFLGKFNGVSTKYLQNYLNWYAYEGKISKTKSAIKTWVLTGMLSPMAYQFYLLFKENAVNIRT